MNRLLPSFALFILFGIANILPISVTNAQSDLWNELSTSEYPAVVENRSQSVAEEYSVFEVDIKQLRQKIADARDGESVSVELPYGNENRAFHLERNSVFPAGLQKKYPGIVPFTAVSKDGSIDARVSLTPLGIQAIFFSDRGISLIEPVDPSSDEYHYQYHAKNANIPEIAFTCGTNGQPNSFDTKEDKTTFTNRSRGESVQLRTYDLVIGSPDEYTDFAGGTVQDALSSITNVVNSMNGYMNRDVGIEFELIEETENLIFTNDMDDPYPNTTNAGEFLANNSGIAQQYVDSDLYDVAHVFSVNCTGGAAGISGGSIVCSNVTRKGSGVSCVYGSLFGFIQTTTHEFGHHLSASHTFSNCPGSGGQLGGAAYEPGSGSTIMSYSGACGSQNIGADDDYFHGASIEEMRFYVTQGQGNSCGTLEDFGNTKPLVSIPHEENLTIPISTPFELTAEASDMENDPVTYCWEQFDLGPISNLGNPIGSAPAFRSFPPMEDPTRIFPELNDILNDNNDPTEVLVDYSRGFTFRCTVRDNNEDNGAQNWEEIEFSTTDKAGPFEVSSIDKDTLKAGNYVEIEWDVSNTDKSPVNCESVNISLSADGGQNFDIPLLNNTPNTGSAFVTIPNVPTNDARIKIKAANNIFFDISDRDLVIDSASSPGYLLSLDRTNLELCLPALTEIALPTESLLGFENDITFSIEDTLPSGINANYSFQTISPGDTNYLNLAFQNRPADTALELTIVAAAPGGDTLKRTIAFTLLSNDFSTLANQQPVSGSKGVAVAPDFSWQPSPAAKSYTLQVATNPNFEELVVDQTGIQDSSYSYNDILADGTIYYWRIIPVNSCGNGMPSAVSAFQTKLVECQIYESEDLPKFIGSSQGATAISTLDIANGGTIEEINVPKVRGSHQYIGDLKARLISPEGTTVKLWSRECFNGTNFNLGFDDDSPNEINCPLTTGQIVKPQTSLNALTGESADGEWRLRIKDFVAGSTGELQAWRIELCSSVSAQSPELIRNDTFELPRGATRNIRSEFHLSVKDQNNSPEEIQYVLVKAPDHGTLNRYDEPMEVGEYFTQRELFDLFVSFTHDNSDNDSDHFRFLAKDPDNGWIGIYRFNVRVNDNVTVDVSDPTEGKQLELFPNPVRDNLTVILPESAEEGQIEVVDLKGAAVYRKKISSGAASRQTIEVSDWNSAMYFVRFSSRKGIYQSKFIVTKD